MLQRTIKRLWNLPSRIRVRVPDINPETGRQRIDRESGERLWTPDDVNVFMYAGVAVLTVVIIAWDELHAAISPVNREERDKRSQEILERIRKRTNTIAESETRSLPTKDKQAMTDRELRTCIKCGGQRVCLERPKVTLSDGNKERRYRFQCLDCGAILFSYQWLEEPDRYTGPSYLDETPEPKGR